MTEIKNKLTRKGFLCLSIVLVLLFLMLGVLAFPFWNGSVIRSKGTVIPSAHVLIPSYYYEAANWLNSMSNDFNILSIPVTNAGALPSYLWQNGTQGYFGQDPCEQIFSQPLLSNVADDNGAVGDVAQLLADNDTNIANILALMNVRYILFHNDYDPELTSAYSTGNPVQILNALNSSKTFVLEKTFGELFFYRNTLWNPNLMTVNAKSAIIVGGDIGNISALVNDEGLADGYSLLSFDNINSFSTSVPSMAASVPIYFVGNTSALSQTVNLYIPQTGSYSLYIAITQSQSDFEKMLTLDNEPLAAFGNVTLQKNGSITIGPINLDKGVHSINLNVKLAPLPIPSYITIVSSPVSLEYVRLTSNNLSIAPSASSNKKTGETLSFNFTQQNPAEYTVDANITSPSYLTLDQLYDLGWVAYVNGSEIDSNSHFNGVLSSNVWFVNETGHLNIVIKFEPQQYAYVGFIVSSISVIISIVLIIKKPAIKLRQFNRKRKTES